MDGSGNADEPGFAPPVVKHVSKEGKLSIGPFGVCVVTAMQQYLLRSILDNSLSDSSWVVAPF